MSEGFIGEIRMFAGNFAPRSWALCDGQLMAVSSNDALFSLLGTTYGGDGRTTFGLPDMRGRIPIHQGTGPGLSNRRFGEKSGTETTTLNPNQLPSHSHALMAESSAASTTSPAGNVLATSTSSSIYGDTGSAALRSDSITEHVGGGGSHTNLMPSLCVNFIIALYGIYPSRS